jgi:hypothetical protein
MIRSAFIRGFVTINSVLSQRIKPASVAGVADLTALQCKQINFAKLAESKRAAMADRLTAILYPAG